MNAATKQYMVRLVRAWAAAPQEPQPVPAAAGVQLDEVRRLLVEHHLEASLGPRLPVEAQDLLWRERMRAARQRTSFLLMELERILPAITATAGRAVVLKGAALAQTHYRPAEQRWFLDLDILVPRDRVDAVCRMLQDRGYDPYHAGRNPLFYEKHHLHRMLTGPQGSHIEIHWDLTVPGSVYGFDVPGVFERARPARLGSCDFLAAAPVDQILHGVYQHIADGYLDLRRVLDAVLLMQDLDEADWRYLVDESRRQGLAAALGTALHLVKDIAGVAPPGGVPARLEPAPLTRRILHGLDLETGCLARRSTHIDGYTAFLHLLLVPRLDCRLRETWRFLWPGEAGLLDLGLPAHLGPGSPFRLRLAFNRLRLLTLCGGRALMALARG